MVFTNDKTIYFPINFFIIFQRVPNIVSWESEGHYQYSGMFCWEPEGCYCCTKSMVIVPFWFSKEHLWIVIAPFWLLTDNIIWIWIAGTQWEDKIKPCKIGCCFMIYKTDEEHIVASFMWRTLLIFNKDCMIWSSFSGKEKK